MAVLITGAAGGIGRASAERLSSRTLVIAADVDAGRADQTAADIRKAGGLAVSVGMDVTDRKSVANAMAWIAREAGPVDALFNNAGINIRTPVEHVDPADWKRVMDTHVKGTYLVSQAVLPQMCERRAGVIVNMSSDYAVIGMPGAAAYAAAKTAIYSLTKSLAREFAPFGIRVNALGPGPIDTQLLRSGRTRDEWEETEDRLIGRVPMGRLGRPEEVAAVLDYLLGDRSAYMTGQLVHPNGGQVSW
jgi:NAD(P)-dependent dehydrogenase (short-subunit alcohol dehydrogenase family)